ncbi:dephospho-CoA kinase [Candidatus Marinamargulisbacteria bacterium SCGC AG-414-C22]|nr:dephospho-CoA kinase [Candidatus Marinamargulisbacteria bacterium SCGC AG-414-C22]
MIIIGITGRVGVGKSTAATIIESHFNATVCDLDLIGHKCLAKTSIKNQCSEAFGTHIFNVDGSINRHVLGDIVFSDSSKLTQLNEIVHPCIKQDVEQQIRAFSVNTIVVIVGALIKEIGLMELCNKIITISANSKKIKEKIGEKYDIISPYQQNQDVYDSYADFVIMNNFDDQFKLELNKKVQEYLDHLS